MISVSARNVAIKLPETFDLFPEFSSTLGAEVTDVVLLCAHMKRDERCGKLGPEVARGLRREFAALGDAGKGVLVLESSHLGGHVYAGNVVHYKRGAGGPVWWGFCSEQSAGAVARSIALGAPEAEAIALGAERRTARPVEAAE